MKKFQLMGVALVAVFAFSVVLSASASAAPTFLLAEWLVNGAAVTEAQEFNSETVGTLLLEDTKTLLNASSVVCSGKLLGTIGFDGLDVISEVLNLSNEAIGPALTGTALSCEEESVCEEGLVWPLHLPWNTLLELMEQENSEKKVEVFFVVLIEESATGGGKPGWEVECMKTITKPVDECVGTGVIELSLEANTLLLGMFLKAFTELSGEPFADCTQSKEDTGVVESIPTELTLTNGDTLNASSESSEA